MRQGEDATLPPRPNLGPEPWPDPARPSAWWVLLALPFFGLAAWRFRRVNARSNPLAVGRHLDEDDASLPADQRLARLADRVRDRLAERFGSGWAAMTTEQLHLALLAGVPIAEFPSADAVSLFHAADRAKFANWPVADDHLGEAEAAAARVLGALADGATISENGR